MGDRKDITQSSAADMKVLFILGLLAFTSAEWTCEECTTLLNGIAALDSSEESIKGQIDVLLAEVCPQLENADECVSELPEFWARLAPIIGPMPSSQSLIVGASVTHSRECEM